jgi:pimeloyl-ACP methyl ester carboxylesterase
MNAVAMSYRTFFEHETSRMLFEGALNTDILQVLEASESEDDWFAGWNSCGARDEMQGRSALQRGLAHSAFEYLLRAANSYRLAQYHLLEDSPRKTVQLSKAAALYRQATALSPTSIEPCDVTVSRQTYRGFLHLPADAGTGGLPCMLLVPGLGHSKESLHHWAGVGITRHCAVWVGDGPGYGEARVLAGIPLNLHSYQDYLEAALERLAVHPALAGGPVGILGDCLGAYYAFRAAALDRRISACVLVEGIFSYAAEQIRGEPLPPLITYHMDGRDQEKIINLHADYCRLAQEMDRPVFAVHAEDDALIPLMAVEQVLAALSGPSELLRVPGRPAYNNYLWNHYNPVLDQLHRMVPTCFDWFLEHSA